MKKLDKFIIGSVIGGVLISSILIFVILTSIQPQKPEQEQPEKTQLEKYVDYFRSLKHTVVESNWSNFTTSTPLFKVDFYDFNISRYSDAYYKNYQLIYYDTSFNILYCDYHNGTGHHVYSVYTEVEK